MKEEVDIVDAHNAIVGKKDRSTAHKEGLLHRVVHIMVFNPNGDLFMQQRSLSCAVFPGWWEGSLSGHVKSGEQTLQAAERELHEELGICVTPKHVKKVLRFGFHEIPEERVLVTLYVVKDVKGQVKLDKDEVKTGDFWPMKKVADEIKKGKTLFHPVFIKALKMLKDMKEDTQDFVKL